MSEVPNFRLPLNFERLMCHNCALVDTYYIIGPLKCRHCDYMSFADSINFEDDWANHQKNQRALSEAQELVASLKFQVDEFEKGWFSTWNSYTTEQLDFEKPQVINPYDFFSGEH